VQAVVIIGIAVYQPNGVVGWWRSFMAKRQAQRNKRGAQQ